MALKGIRTSKRAPSTEPGMQRTQLPTAHRTAHSDLEDGARKRSEITSTGLSLVNPLSEPLSGGMVQWCLAHSKCPYVLALIIINVNANEEIRNFTRDLYFQLSSHFILS